MSRRFDIVILGPGFTGSLCAKYLAHVAKLPSSRWCLAGRSTLKLQKLRDTLRLPDLALRTVNLSDQTDLMRLTADTKVVINCIGPFILHAEPVVRACCVTKTHYTDITGEPAFLDMVLQKYSPTAASNGVVLLPAAGFDSVPCDVGLYNHLRCIPSEERQRTGSKPNRIVRGYVKMSGGGISKGTFSTIMENMGRRSVLSAVQVSSLPRYAGDVKSWVVPFPSSDPWIAERQLTLRGMNDIRYEHYLQQKSFFMMLVTTFAIVLLHILSFFGPLRRAIINLREDNAGPSEESRSKSNFSLQFVSRSADAGSYAHTSVDGVSAYDLTAVSVCEAAIMLSNDEYDKAATGLSTPSVSLGDAYVQRMQKALSYSVKGQVHIKRKDE